MSSKGLFWKVVFFLALAPLAFAEAVQLFDTSSLVLDDLRWDGQVIGDNLYLASDNRFSAAGAGVKSQVTKLDGLTGTIATVFNQTGGTTDSLPDAPVVFQGNLYFIIQFGSAEFSGPGGQLWKISAQEDAPELVYTFENFRPYRLKATESFLCIVCINGELRKTSLWRSNGSGAGTAQVTYELASYVNSFYSTSSRIFFQYSDELFTLGVSGSPVMIGDNLGFGDGFNVLEVSDRTYFTARDNPSIDGYQLWSTDGTLAGTRKETSIQAKNSKEATIEPAQRYLARIGAKIIFSRRVAGLSRLYAFSLSAADNRISVIGDTYTTSLPTSWDGGLAFVRANGFGGGDLEFWREGEVSTLSVPLASSVDNGQARFESGGYLFASKSGVEAGLTGTRTILSRFGPNSRQGELLKIPEVSSLYPIAATEKVAFLTCKQGAGTDQVSRLMLLNLAELETEGEQEGGEEGETEGDQDFLAQVAQSLLDGFGSIDSDGSGGLSAAEIATAGLSVSSERFRALDVDRDGAITAAELLLAGAELAAGGCACSGEKSLKQSIQSFLGDFAVVGIALMALLAMSTAMRKPGEF